MKVLLDLWYEDMKPDDPSLPEDVIAAFKDTSLFPSLSRRAIAIVSQPASSGRLITESEWFSCTYMFPRYLQITLDSGFMDVEDPSRDSSDSARQVVHAETISIDNDGEGC